MSRPLPPEHPPETPEARLERLLTAYHAADGDEQRRLAAECLAEVAAQFEQALRKGLGELFGDKTRQPGSAAFTAVLGSLFERVLERRRDDPEWRARSARELRGWVAQALANTVRDVLRSRQRRERLLVDYAEGQQQHFAAKWGIDLAPALSVLDAWKASTDPRRATNARILHEHYYGGRKISEIAVELGLESKTVSNRKAEALAELRELCHER